MLDPIKFDNINIDYPILLAPLSGVSDVPFRHAILDYWAGMVYSEMVASRTQLQDVKKSLKIIEKAKKQKYSAVQLAGYDPYYVSEAVKLNTDLGADIIDLNFGCPAKKIVTNAAGSALLHPDNLDRGIEIIKSAVSATHLPITLKMRLGWDHEMLTGGYLAKIAEDLGIKMLTVHGRTRCQFYTGTADWQLIGDIRDKTTLPLIVNGDIIDTASAKKALSQSGADGIMIGRGCYGKPWLLQAIRHELATDTPYNPPSKHHQLEKMINHYKHIIEFYGEKMGIRIGRKHLHWYREALGIDPYFSKLINKALNPQGIITYLQDVVLPSYLEGTVQCNLATTDITA